MLLSLSEWWHLFCKQPWCVDFTKSPGCRCCLILYCPHYSFSKSKLYHITIYVVWRTTILYVESDHLFKHIFSYNHMHSMSHFIARLNVHIASTLKQLRKLILIKVNYSNIFCTGSRQSCKPVYRQQDSDCYANCCGHSSSGVWATCLLRISTRGRLQHGGMYYTVYRPSCVLDAPCSH